MKLFFLAGTAVLISAAAAFSSAVQEKQAQFFAGVFLLQSKTDISPVDQAKMYRDLEALTSITTVEAQALLTVYRAKPAEWQKLYDSIIKLIAQVQPAVKGEAAPALPAQRR